MRQSVQARHQKYIVLGAGGYFGQAFTSVLKQEKKEYIEIKATAVDVKNGRLPNQRELGINADTVIVNCSVVYKNTKYQKLINVDLPIILAKLAKSTGAKLIQISTINVAQPINDRYTNQKLEAEIGIEKIHPSNYSIVRLPLLVDMQGRWLTKKFFHLKWCKILVLPKFDAFYAPLDIHKASLATYNISNSDTPSGVHSLFGSEVLQLFDCIKRYSGDATVYGVKLSCRFLLSRHINSFFGINRSITCIKKTSETSHVIP